MHVHKFVFQFTPEEFVPDLEHAPRTAMIAWYMLHDAWECTSLGAEPAPWEVCTLPDCVCEWMHVNALECVRMRMNAWECVRMHTRVSMHESWSWASPLGGLHSPWLRVWVNASECAWMRKNASARVRQNATCDRMHLMCGGIQMHLNATHVECNAPWMRLNA